MPLEPSVLGERESPSIPASHVTLGKPSAPHSNVDWTLYGSSGVLNAHGENVRRVLDEARPVPRLTTHTLLLRQGRRPRDILATFLDSDSKRKDRVRFRDLSEELSLGVFGIALTPPANVLEPWFAGEIGSFAGRPV